MGILIIFPVFKIFHHGGGGISQMEGDILKTGFFNVIGGFFYTEIGCIAFRGGCQESRDLCKNNRRFRHAHGMNGLKAADGYCQTGGFCISDIFRGKNNYSPGDEERIFTPLQVDSEPVNRCIRITATNTFYESGYGVIMIISRFIVKKIFLL